jgi:uncharacterized membrane protein
MHMDTLIYILFWIHLVSLGLGGAAVFGLPIVGSRMAAATPETRPVLFSIAHVLSNLGRAAIGLLIVTGPLMLWLRFGGPGALSGWFWAKMVLVVLLLAVVIVGGINAGKAEGGDREAAKRAPLLGVAAMVVFILIVGCAVLTFG